MNKHPVAVAGLGVISNTHVPNKNSLLWGQSWH